MNIVRVKGSSTAAPKSVPAPGATSAIGHRAPAFKAPGGSQKFGVRPQAGSTRMYGKADQQSAPTNPFGYDSGGIS